jgi:hypothetical protein
LYLCIYVYIFSLSLSLSLFCVHTQATKSDVSSEGEWYFTSTNEKPIGRRLDFDSESQSAAGPGQTYGKMTKNTQNENEGNIDSEMSSKKRNNTPMVS